MKVYNDFLWSRGLCLCEKDTDDVAPTTVGYRCQRYIISKELAMYMYRRQQSLNEDCIKELISFVFVQGCNTVAAKLKLFAAFTFLLNTSCKLNSRQFYSLVILIVATWFPVAKYEKRWISQAREFSQKRGLNCGELRGQFFGI